MNTNAMQMLDLQNLIKLIADVESARDDKMKIIVRMIRDRISLYKQSGDPDTMPVEYYDGLINSMNCMPNGSHDTARYIRIAALCIAACEALDREERNRVRNRSAGVPNPTSGDSTSGATS